MAPVPYREQWHLDKKVPIALILVAFGHLGGSVWFFRGLLADVQNTQSRVQSLEQAKTTERSGERLAVVESQVSDIKVVMLRVEANVQKLVERSGSR